MSFAVFNNIIVGNSCQKDQNDPLYLTPGDTLIIGVTTRYKPDGNISVTQGIAKDPLEFEMSGPVYIGENWNHEKFIHYKISFVMPFNSVRVEGSFTTKWEEHEMDDIKETAEKERTPDENGVLDTFTIPEELAQELSDLLIKQSIRMNSVNACVGDPEKYEQAEEMLIPITVKVDKIKHQISTEFVPKKYRSSRYRWNFNGWEIDNNVIQILYS